MRAERPISLPPTPTNAAFQQNRKRSQRSDVVHIEFAICAETMDLNRAFADAEFQGDLTIEFAFGNQQNHIAFSFRELSVALLPLRFVNRHGSSVAVFLHNPSNGFEQFFRIHGF